MLVYWNLASLRHSVEIPVVQVLLGDMQGTVDAIKFGKNFTISLTADENPWVGEEQNLAPLYILPTTLRSDVRVDQLHRSHANHNTFH